MTTWNSKQAAANGAKIPAGQVPNTLTDSAWGVLANRSKRLAEVVATVSGDAGDEARVCLQDIFQLLARTFEAQLICCHDCGDHLHPGAREDELMVLMQRYCRAAYPRSPSQSLAEDLRALAEMGRQGKVPIEPKAFEATISLVSGYLMGRGH